MKANRRHAVSCLIVLLASLPILQGCSAGEQLTANQAESAMAASSPQPLVVRFGPVRSGNTLADFRDFLITYGASPEAWTALRRAELQPAGLFSDGPPVYGDVMASGNPQFAVRIEGALVRAAGAMLFSGTFAEIEIALKVTDLVSNMTFPDNRSSKLFWSGLLGINPAWLTPAVYETTVTLSRECGFAVMGTGGFSTWWSILPVDFSFDGIRIPTQRMGYWSASINDSDQSPDCPPPPPPSKPPGGTSGGGTWMYWIECTGDKVYVWENGAWRFVGYENVVCTSTPIWVPEYEI